MTGVKRTAATVYELTVEAKVCNCPGPPTVLWTGRILDRGVSVADGYWALYLAFWGDQIVWLWFTITDIRDGQVVWRNGRPTKGESSGQIPGTEPV